ncbi:MAG: hypothetical protein DME26_22445 [Verrucomicrobia bacterium]|nr:MAG: hypothetical protein DME26_22445 [Verrucomicrobiota bacterium]
MGKGEGKSRWYRSVFRGYLVSRRPGSSASFHFPKSFQTGKYIALGRSVALEHLEQIKSLLKGRKCEIDATHHTLAAVT